MENNMITAEQARKNSLESTYGTAEILRNVYSSIEANSKTGKTKISKFLSIQAVTEEELKKAEDQLRENGYEVVVKTNKETYCLHISW